MLSLAELEYYILKMKFVEMLSLGNHTYSLHLHNIYGALHVLEIGNRDTIA